MPSKSMVIPELRLFEAVGEVELLEVLELELEVDGRVRRLLRYFSSAAFTFRSRELISLSLACSVT